MLNAIFCLTACRVTIDVRLKIEKGIEKVIEI